jgi:outer membrane biosynthesis protein TonB
MSPSQSTIRIKNRISLASGAGGENSGIGLLGAVMLHIAFVGLMFFTWVHRLDIADQSPPVVPVDLVTVGQKTNIEATERPAPRIAPVPLPQPQQNVEMPAPQVEQEAEPAPQPVAKPVPPKPKPESKLSDILKQLTAQQAPPKKDKLAAILKQWTAPSPQSSNARAGSVTHKGIGAQNANTMDLVDALRNQIEQCWSPPAGSPHPEQLIVYVELTLNPDGSVAGSPHLTAESQSAANGNPFMHAAAEAAMRAIYVCQPFKQLPADRYQEWRDSTIKFDPRDLADQ